MEACSATIDLLFYWYLWYDLIHCGLPALATGLLERQLRAAVQVAEVILLLFPASGSVESDLFSSCLDGAVLESGTPVVGSNFICHVVVARNLVSLVFFFHHLTRCDEYTQTDTKRVPNAKLWRQKDTKSLSMSLFLVPNYSCIQYVYQISLYVVQFPSLRLHLRLWAMKLTTKIGQLAKQRRVARTNVHDVSSPVQVNINEPKKPQLCNWSLFKRDLLSNCNWVPVPSRYG